MVCAKQSRAPCPREPERRGWSELRVARVAVSPPSCANRATTKTCCAPHDSTIPHAHSVLSKVRNKLGRSRHPRQVGEKLAAARQGSECARYLLRARCMLVTESWQTRRSNRRVSQGALGALGVQSAASLPGRPKDIHLENLENIQGRGAKKRTQRAASFREIL